MVLSDHCRRPRSTFFRHVFDDFEVFYFLDGPRGAREALGGRFGRVLGNLEGVRGSPGSVLGGSWAVLERSWRPSCSKTIFDLFLERFWGRFGRPKGGQEGTKTGPKADQNRRQKRCRKKTLLKTLLEPSWGDLRAFWRPSWGPKKHFRIGKTNTGAKFTFFMKISVQEAF